MSPLDTYRAEPALPDTCRVIITDSAMQAARDHLGMALDVIDLAGALDTAIRHHLFRAPDRSGTRTLWGSNLNGRCLVLVTATAPANPEELTVITAGPPHFYREVRQLWRDAMGKRTRAQRDARRQYRARKRQSDRNKQALP